MERQLLDVPGAPDLESHEHPGVRTLAGRIWRGAADAAEIRTACIVVVADVTAREWRRSIAIEDEISALETPEVDDQVRAFRGSHNQIVTVHISVRRVV